MSFRFRCVGLFLQLSAAIGGILAAGPIHAATNPIDVGLPSSIHARTSCLDGSVVDNVSSTTLLHIDHAFKAACTGVVDVQSSGSLSGLTGNDSASANLQTGTLRARATGRSLSDSSANVMMRAGAQSYAYLYDTLTFDGNLTGTQAVKLTLSVHGTLSSVAPTPNWQSSEIGSALQIISAVTGAQMAYGGVSIRQGNDGIPFLLNQPDSVNVQVTTNTLGGQVFDPADVAFSFTYLFPASVDNRSFTFLSRLSVTAGMGFGTGLDGIAAEGTVDFGNTARLSLDLPPGVTMTSASGQFLVPIPEPHTYALFVAGLAVLLGRLAWKRRQTVVIAV